MSLMKNKKAILTAVNNVGSLSRFAAVLTPSGARPIARSTVHMWMRQGYIPSNKRLLVLDFVDKYKHVLTDPQGLIDSVETVRSYRKKDQAVRENHVFRNWVDSIGGTHMLLFNYEKLRQEEIANQNKTKKEYAEQRKQALKDLQENPKLSNNPEYQYKLRPFEEVHFKRLTSIVVQNWINRYRISGIHQPMLQALGCPDYVLETMINPKEYFANKAALEHNSKALPLIVGVPKTFDTPDLSQPMAPPKPKTKAMTPAMTPPAETIKTVNDPLNLLGD